jgi:protein-export membrane protein SecD/preprotein translocase SecF subunit
MMRKPANLAVLAFILVLTAVAVIIVWPSNPGRYLPDFIPWPKGQGLTIGNLDRETMRLGLDLKGGTYVLLEGDTSALPSGSSVDDAMKGVQDIIERRVNAYGVSESEIQREGSNRLSVQLPGISQQDARDLIGRTALLEFREPERDESGNIVCQDSSGQNFTVPADTVTDQNGNPRAAYIVGDANGNLTQCQGPNDVAPTGSVVWKPATGVGNDGVTKALTGRFLRANSRVVFDPLGKPQVALEFNSEGGKLFDQLTSRLVGLPMAIFLDEDIISAPTILTRISDGNSVITGPTADEGRKLAIQLNSGALPVPLRVIQESTVDATLGDDSVRHSVQAGEIAILAVMIFMVLYYRVPGVLASLALVTYTSTVLMIFKLWPVTLTLSGIAAFVLSVGMAVDANVLVFERLKEELRAGRNLVTAIETGFNRAWTSIRDSNVSTLITCGILWWFGDQFGASLVKGFALTLAIGVLLSMFSAIIVTRTFLRLVVGTPFARRLGWFGGEAVRPSAAAMAGLPVGPGVADGSPISRGGGHFLDFVGRRGFYYLLSLAILVPGVISLLIQPALKPGIEFSAGTSFTVRFEQSVSQSDVRAALADVGHPEARVQRTTEGDFILRMGELQGASDVPPVGPALPSERDSIENELRNRVGPLTVRDFNSVSEIVSREIGRNATIAVLAASVAIVLYISFAFRGLAKPWRYGIAAILATLHDVVVVVGLFSIFGKVFGTEVNTMFITGLLTVIGFSTHDTIVVFDRIRENVGRNPGVGFAEVVNASLTETLARSINTSMTVIVTLAALLLLGGVTIQSFLVVLLIGVISGTYSSIFVASQILVSWEEGDVGRILGRFFPRLAPAPGR